MRIAVIGGGISGLSAAYFIKKADPSHEITVFEKEARPGGKIATLSEGGFLAETGPNGYLDNKPFITGLAASLGISGGIIKADAAAAVRYIYNGRGMYRLPETPPAFLKSGLISAAGKIRIMMEPFIPRKKSDEDESVASFTRRRIGREALDMLISPMVSGIYAGDPEKLSLKSAFPRMYELERDYGSLFKAMIKLGRGGAPPGKLTGFDRGMGVLTDALHESLGGIVKTGSGVDDVNNEGGTWNVSGRGFGSRHDAVVFAVPSYELAGMFRPAAELCRRIDYAPLAVVHLGFSPKETVKNAAGFGFLTAGKVKSTVLGAVYASNIFADRAPEGASLITVMAGGAKNPDAFRLDDDALLRGIGLEMELMAGISAAPVYTRIIRHEKAIPNYCVGHPGIVRGMTALFTGLPRAFLAGNAFYGISASDAVKRAAAVADEITGQKPGNRDQNPD